MQLSSPAFVDRTAIPQMFTCKGQNVCPTLQIQNIPPNTKSLAIILHDPDAIHGDFTHWTIWNIPAQTTQLTPGALPAEAIQGLTDFGTTGYGGPCPPAGSGTHRYIFELYALNALIDLPATTSRSILERELTAHSIEQAQLVGIVSA